MPFRDLLPNSLVSRIRCEDCKTFYIREHARCCSVKFEEHNTITWVITTAVWAHLKHTGHEYFIFLHTWREDKFSQSTFEH